MPLSFLHYKLGDGYILNWLAAGPQTLSIPDKVKSQPDSKIAQTFFSTNSGISELPVERGPLSEGSLQIGDFKGAWKYFHCSEDRFVYFHSKFLPSTYMRAWAYAQLKSRTDREVKFIVTTFGPVDVWLNDIHIFRSDEFSKDHLIHHRIPIRLGKGTHSLLLRFEQLSSKSRSFAGALRICEVDEKSTPVTNVSVLIPTTIPHVTRRNELERALSNPFIRKDIFSLEDNPQNNVNVEWPPIINQQAITYVRLQTPEGRIYAQSEDRGSPGEIASLGYVSSLLEGPYEITLMPSPREYYEENIRISRTFPVWVVGNHDYSRLSYGTVQSRKAEALLEASRQAGQLDAEIAKMALNQWGKLDKTTLQNSIHDILTNSDRILTLMCLLGLSYRFGKNENFPADVSKSIEECVLNFPFTQDTLDEYDESEQIKFHTCKILAGQKFARRIFPLSKLKGKQLFEQGVKDSIAWLLEKGRYGLKAWDSDEHLAQIIVALTHLIDLAEDESVFNLAAVLLDKILVGIAINAHQGVLASACGQGTSLGVNSALTKATAGISRIFWGHGIFNHHTSGYVSVACMTNYELPSIIGDIATSKEELLGWEKHAETSKVTYRTVEFMLSSAVGYKTGERGSREHIWQATLGPEAIVYVNHPGNSAWDDAITPNYWLGNVVLPHLAQHKDALIAMYNLPPDDWMGFTHAYFPTFSFDEYVLKKNWAFARKGESYLAITASGKVNFFESGAGAYRELRCTGQKPIWVCQLGSAALDGNFTTFVQKVSELNLVFHGLAVEYNTLRGDKLQLTWDGKLSINDKEQANEDQFHYNYPFLKAEYPCHKMEIEYNGYILRLDFHPNGD